jgi:hypothetical protein
MRRDKIARCDAHVDDVSLLDHDHHDGQSAAGLEQVLSFRR